MPSLRDVARLAGASVSTASKVLNTGTELDRISEECARRVRRAARKLGYRRNYHARSLLTGRAHTIGVSLQIEPGTNVLGDAYWGTLIGGVEAHARGHGYEVLLVGPTAGEMAAERGLEHAHGRRLDGLINMGWIDPRIVRCAERADVPVVLVNSELRTSLPVIELDDRAGIHAVVRHLVELGHRELLWLGPRQDWPKTPALRRDAFTKALRESGAHGRSCTFSFRPGTRDGQKLIESGERALAARLGDGRAFTAVVCYNDVTAVGAYRAARAAGLRIPDDLSVTGFDDAYGTYFCPGLTTVSHMFETGHRASILVLEMCENPDQRRLRKGYRERVVPQLVVRGSTGQPGRRNQ